MAKSTGTKAAWAVAGAMALLLLASWAGIVRGGPLDPSGPPGPTMKTLQEVEPRSPISTMPMVIAAPGSYYLTGNLTHAGGAAAGIEVAADDVTIDLNGFTLSGVPGTTSAIASAGARKNITIRNGTIRAFGQAGIGLFTSDNVHVERINVEGTGNLGISVQNRSVVEDCVVKPGGTLGINVGTDSRVANCTVTNSGWNGIRVGARSLVSDCVVTSAGASGVTDALKAGIYAAQASIIRGCIVTSTSGSGILVEDRVVVIGNTVSLSTLCGIDTQLLGQNRFEDNHLIANITANACIESAGNVLFSNVATGTALNYSIAAGNIAPIEIGTATQARSNVEY